ncbi:transporter [Dokdonella sp.]|uniref:transporter n=1 Tax=Dokdonella sp. TaxID=2291710 RepID=UPI0037851587
MMQRIAWHFLAALAAGLPMVSASAQSGADPAPPARQSLDDAWWTGPVVANSPAPLPLGHFYVESYLFDVRSDGGDGFGSQTYLLYGLTDRWTVGLRPSFGYTRPVGGSPSAHVGVGDLALHAHYALTTLDPGSGTPAIALAIEESLPIGRHDRLDRASNGFGNGAYVTTLAVYAQQVFWLPNGRILRGRINIGGSLSSRAPVHDLSVYGTSAGFDGTARPGASVSFDNAWEYSITRNWVLAADFYYRHDAPTSVRDASGTRRTGTFDTFALVPAVEYNWSPRIGVIAGARYIPARGHNARSLTPIVALSVFL